MRFLSMSCARSAIMAANGACSPDLVRFLYSEKYSLLRSASCAGEMCRLILNHFDFFVVFLDFNGVAAAESRDTKSIYSTGLCQRLHLKCRQS